MFMAKLIQIIVKTQLYQGNFYQLTGGTKLAIKLVIIITELFLLCTEQLEYSGENVLLHQLAYYVYSYYYPSNYIVYLILKLGWGTMLSWWGMCPSVAHLGYATGYHWTSNFVPNYEYNRDKLILAIPWKD